MGVYERADSKYFWMLLEPTGKKMSTGVPHAAPDAMSRKIQRDHAEEIYRARMTDLARDAHHLPRVDKTTIAFDVYAKWFTKHHLAKRRGAEREMGALQHLIAFFGADDLATISRDRVHEYTTARMATRIKYTKRTLSPRTVNREVSLLKGMLREAVPTYLKASPIARLKPLRVITSKKRILDPEEEARLLEQLEPRDRALLIVAVDTLVRLSNILNLTRAEDHGTHLALVDSKTGPYEVPLSQRAREALDSIAGDEPYYFEHRRTAKTERDRRGVIRRMLKRACERCEPPIPYGRAHAGITFHTATRATGATRMLRAGADLRTVQGVGNWSDLRSLQVYLHTDEDAKRRAVDLIGQHVPAAKKPDPA